MRDEKRDSKCVLEVSNELNGISPFLFDPLPHPLKAFWKVTAVPQNNADDNSNDDSHKHKS